jgi:flavin reductase (DIM6/NTAB) family NADH-FMN oxidoreductase RutF
MYLDAGMAALEQFGPYVSQAVVDAGIALVTSAGRERRNVMTASFFAESSHIPVLVRVAIAPSCLTHALVSESGWFGLSVMSQGQENVALYCGSVSGREVEKLERSGLSHELSPRGIPLLRDCLTTSECRVVATIPLHDHTLFVGEVITSFTQSRLSFRDPLLISDLRGYTTPVNPDA